MDISIALENLGSGTLFDYSGSLTGNDEAAYDALIWNDGRTKPTWSEIQAASESYTNVFEIQQKIDELELSITYRRVREAFLNRGQGMQFIQEVDDRIEVLRTQLP